MLFHVDDKKDALIGWVLPDNPKAIPSIRILKPDGSSIEVEANALRTDLRDRGGHETGMIGFNLTKRTHAEIMEFADEIEIREVQTNAVIFRRFHESMHINKKLFRFELRAMPDPHLEGLFAKRFTYAYGAVQRYPQDTFFGIFNNPNAKSIYIAGCPKYQQYEQMLRQRQYMVVALIRDPYEEMAERLLFARYASSPNAPSFIAEHIFGLEPLVEMVRKIKFGDTDSIRAAFDAITPQQRDVLNNPLVRALACPVEQPPKMSHVPIALSKLSHMDLVGISSRFAEFKSVLQETIGVDVLESYQLTSLSWVQRIAAQLPEVRQARNLISLDLELYAYAEEAISEALGPPPVSEKVA